MCHEAGSRHDTLVLHTDICWLSKRKVLARFFDLKNELLNMFGIKNPDFAAQLNDEEWCANVAYKTDTFSHLINYLNESMQGKEENVLTSSDKLTGFLRKHRIWKLQVERKNLQMFPLTSKVDPHGDVTSELILNHLRVLEDKMVQYVPSITVAEYDWVHNPYAVSPEPTTNLPLEKEELAEIQLDRTLQLKYGELSLLKF
jgi:hypothetical protein